MPLLRLRELRIRLLLGELPNLGQALSRCLPELDDANQALLLAETANLLMLRPPKNQGQPVWFERATDLRGICFAERPAEAGGKVAFLFPGQGSQYPDMLAQVAAASGYQVSMFDSRPEAADKAIASIGQTLQKLAAKGKIAAEEAAATRAIADSLGVKNIALTITHDGNTALAQVIFES